jgi:hypothetical protein
MSLKDQLSQDAVNSFLNSDEFGEAITYTPKDGAAKQITALVIRERLKPGDEDSGRILRNQCEVYIANDATNGVTSVDKGDDILAFPILLDEDSVEWVVVDIISKDSGMWHLLVSR